MSKVAQGKGPLGRIALLIGISAGVIAVVLGIPQIMDRLRPCSADLQISEVQDSEYPSVEFLVRSSCTQLLTEIVGTVIKVEDTAAVASIEDLSSISVSRTYDVPVKISNVTTVGWTFEWEIAQQAKAGEYDRFRLRLLLEDGEAIELLSSRGSNAVAVTFSLRVRSISGKTLGSGEVRLVFKSESNEFGAMAIEEL